MTDELASNREEEDAPMNETFTNQTNSPWTNELKERVLQLADKGLGPSEIARLLGMKKNQLSGWLDRNNCSYDGPTSMDRLQALHDKMDAVLAENAPWRCKK